MEHPDYYRLREHLIEFLEVRAHGKATPVQLAPPSTQSGVPFDLAVTNSEDPRHCPVRLTNSEQNPMKHILKRFTSARCCAAAQGRTSAQYAPPPPPAPFQGFINEWLRKDNPYMNQWDFGGAIRARYELKDNFSIPGEPGSLDFRDHGAEWITPISWSASAITSATRTNGGALMSKAAAASRKAMSASPTPISRRRRNCRAQRRRAGIRHHRPAPGLCHFGQS